MTLWEELNGHCERQTNTVIVTATNTDTQVIRVPWTAPANKSGILESLFISNQAADTIVKIFDAELITTGTPGTTLPPVRGTAAAPLLPWINVLASSQFVLDKQTCPNIPVLSGIAVQVTTQPVHIFASILVVPRGS
jgi:hypothetical protein